MLLHGPSALVIGIDVDREARRHLRRIGLIAVRARHARRSAPARAWRIAPRPLVDSLADPKGPVTACALQSHRNRSAAPQRLTVCRCKPKHYARTPIDNGRCATRHT